MVYCIHCIHWFDPFALKTMSPPPYTTIPLHPLCTAFTAYCVYCIHWFDLFAPKKMSPPPYTTIPLHPCVLCPLHTVSTASTGLTFLYQRQCPHHHIPLFHCIHCILCPLHPLVFAPKTMFPPPYTTILLHPVCTAFIAYCVHCILHPLRTVSTVCCIHCILHPLHTASTAYCVHCILHPLCAGLTFLL